MTTQFYFSYGAFYHLLACARFDDETGRAAGVEATLWEVTAFSDSGATICFSPAPQLVAPGPAYGTLH